MQITQNPHRANPKAASPPSKSSGMPDLSSFEGKIPMELFTPEALEACPYARAMFEQMKTMGAAPKASSPQPMQVQKLAESGSWIEAKAPENFQPTTQATADWTPRAEYESVMNGAAKNVPDNALTGEQKAAFKQFTRERIDSIQNRQLQDGETMERLVHTDQLFGGEVEVHWNPALKELVDFFGQESSGGLVRVSDASNEKNPDGKSMYGMALELVGQDGQVTDILMTGGSELTEASQSQDPKAQLALFNMLDHPNKVGGLVQMAWEVGPIETAKMVIDVGRMKTDLNSVSDLTSWSRAPFRLQGKDGDSYLVKMRSVPMGEPANESQKKDGQTSFEHLKESFQTQASEGDTRWSFELQFMQPGDDPNDGRETWSGPWLKAGEIVIPKIEDQARAEVMAKAADDTKFNIWKGKEAHDKGPDYEVFYPHGWTNQARLWAYGQSAKNRGVGA